MLVRKFLQNAEKHLLEQEIVYHGGLYRAADAIGIAQRTIAYARERHGINVTKLYRRHKRYTASGAHWPCGCGVCIEYLRKRGAR
jgi:hypothetical protein